MMDKLTFYRYAAIALLALNLAILTFFFLYRPFVNGPLQGPPNHLELGLDEEQKEAFYDLVATHQTMMRRINEEQKDLLTGYFNTLADDAQDNLLSVPQRYTVLEEEKISGTYDHFLQIKALLQPDQRQKFPAFVDRALINILGQKKKPPRRPKDRS